jgi:hypothetical protein
VRPRAQPRRVAKERHASTPVSLRPDDVLSMMLAKQHLHPGAAGHDVPHLLDDLVGCHGTLALSPYLQLRARIPTFGPDQLDGLLEAGRAAKVGCMRRTRSSNPRRSSRSCSRPRASWPRPGGSASWPPMDSLQRDTSGSPSASSAVDRARAQRPPPARRPRGRGTDLTRDHRHVRPGASRPLEGRARLVKRPAHVPAHR